MAPATSSHPIQSRSRRHGTGPRYRYRALQTCQFKQQPVHRSHWRRARDVASPIYARVLPSSLSQICRHIDAIYLLSSST